MVDQVRNRQEQAEIYGETFDEVVRRLGRTLSLTQAQLAEVLGISAPMLSQLVTGKRVKLGHPASLRRLDALQELTDQMAAGDLDPEELASRLAEIRQVSGHRTVSQAVTVPAPAPSTQAAQMVQRLLREVASGADLRAAVELLAPTQPALAELLRIYGLGTPQEADAHYRAHGD